MARRIHFSESKFARRWSPAVSKEGFTAVPVSLLRDLKDYDLSHQEILVLLHLLSYWYYGEGENKIFPTVTTMAAKLKMGRSTVGRHLATLEAKGFIEREPQVGYSNLYHLDGTVKQVYRHQVSRHPAQIREDPHSEVIRPPLSKVSTIKEELEKRKINPEDLKRELSKLEARSEV